MYTVGSFINHINHVDMAGGGDFAKFPYCISLFDKIVSKGERVQNCPRGLSMAPLYKYAIITTLMSK